MKLEACIMGLDLHAAFLEACGMHLEKYHGLGNDYFVLNPSTAKLPEPKELQALCKPHFGWGSDGLLYGPLPAREGQFSLRIFNPDGSEAEKSGNGLRIFARYLYDIQAVREAPFTIETLGGLVRAQVLQNGAQVRVQMGSASFQSEQIPFIEGPTRSVVDEAFELKGSHYRFCAVSIGNPHIVVLVDAADKALACQLGPELENRTQWFPNRTNVQLLQVLDGRRLRVESWERGVGYTLACGSGVSAAAAAARRMGLCEASVRVETAAGGLEVDMDDQLEVTLTGPVVRVGSCEVDASIFQD